MKRVLWVTAKLAVMAVVILLLLSSDNGQAAETLPTVTVTRGDIVDKALAVGTIEPRVEISVKSQVAGVVRRLFVDAGDYVEAGTPLLEIQPNPTPLELIDAERRIELRQLEVDNLRREFERQQQLFDRRLISEQEYERARRAYEEARLQLQAAREQLALLREGRVQTESGRFETVVRAPISGYVLEKMIEVGDPVVPLTSYQEGTVLMTMADMNDLSSGAPWTKSMWGVFRKA
ncbi:efflux RND transporter periplasmic adaptor subunit [Rhodothermus marinus]|uniref:efflux RND transporter periplasmic adaptor subunit n=1 Tax=Rhodothermus marinus TaxID=29549 RepID=UPI000B11D805|nr:efflux RND transporter periplasmic adaptor subunit [Rhodothermus marinus]